ncbi:MAG: MBL fold metallo-hydrolase [Methanopyri archaeon]|nr:MBL fold metallo-hydrolase [Methanopyri archaeon]
MREMRILFIGTGGAIPTEDRGHPSLLVEYDSTKILVDCGEGTQTRAKSLHGESLHDVDAVLITHHHADHVSGLVPLATTVSMLHGRNLRVYGPEPGDEAEALDVRECEGIDYETLDPGDEVEVGNLRVKAFESRHGVPCLDYRVETDVVPGKADPKALNELPPERRGEALRERGSPYTITEPGRISVYLKGDGRPADPSNVKGCDLLVHEATFDDPGDARRYMHSTHVEAAEVAKKANVTFLVLTHFSAKVDPVRMREEAKEVFPNVVTAEDGLRISLRRL